jgi:hypothetical protein
MREVTAEQTAGVATGRSDKIWRDMEPWRSGGLIFGIDHLHMRSRTAKSAENWRFRCAYSD